MDIPTLVRVAVFGATLFAAARIVHAARRIERLVQDDGYDVGYLDGINRRSPRPTK